LKQSPNPFQNRAAQVLDRFNWGTALDETLGVYREVSK
jgi:hypothetical protein